MSHVIVTIQLVFALKHSQNETRKEKNDTWNAANFTFGNNIYTAIATMISVFV